MDWRADELKYAGPSSVPILEQISTKFEKSHEGSGDYKELRGDPEREDLIGRSSTATLSRRIILSYGTGHMLNDLTAACWFTYLLIFLTDVGLSPKQAASVMLAGQLADALSTVVIGQLIDGFGHFKSWHAGGAVLVAISFSSVFGGCIPCILLGTNSFAARTISYCVFAAIFNVGWASTQVSHMSLVSCITANSTSRVALNSCRNAFTMVANLCLYAIAYAVFWKIPASSSEAVHNQFLWIAGASILTGSCFVLVFFIGVKEPRLHHHELASKGTYTRVSWMSWFRKILYYQVALVYMLTRLTTNVSQALLPFYLMDDLQMHASSKAVVPAVIYMSSFLASIILQELKWTSSRLKCFFAGGAFLWIASGAVIYFHSITLKPTIYVLAGVIGVGNAFMLVTATSMEGVLVGHNLSGCAFVYGSLSFFDKVACGVALYVIESLNDETRSCARQKEDIIDCHTSLIQGTLGLVPSGCAFLAAVITFMMSLNETEADISSAHSKPLLQTQCNNEILTIVSSQDEVRAMINDGRESRRSIACSIIPRLGSATDRSRNFESVAESHDANCTQQSTPKYLWKLLESAMVGRWGSIRKSSIIWLD